MYFYIEDFEERALDLAPHKPLCWFRYVDDTFVIWPHGTDKLGDFLNHLNSIHQCNQFTMESESEGHHPFLDIDIYRRPDGSLGHRVYCKPTHTNLYPNAGSHHHPSNKQAALSTQGQSSVQSRQPACRVGVPEGHQNGYNNRQLSRVLNWRPHINQPNDNRDSVAFLPYFGTVLNRISRVLSQHNINSVGLPPEKISNFLLPAKKPLRLRTPGIYRILCECGKVYIGQTGCSVDTRLEGTSTACTLRTSRQNSCAGTQHRV
jgi:hypothetical protein